MGEVPTREKNDMTDNDDDTTVQREIDGLYVNGGLYIRAPGGSIVTFCVNSKRGRFLENPLRLRDGHHYLLKDADGVVTHSFHVSAVSGLKYQKTF